MRKLLGLSCIEIAIISGGVWVTTFMSTTPVWVWPTICILALAAAGLLYIQEIRALVLHERPKAIIAPENQPLEKKVYTARSPAALFEACRTKTSANANKYIKPHIGKWIKVQNRIQDIEEDEQYFFVILGHWADPAPRLRFDKNRWGSEIETMDRGDRLAAEGKIVHVGIMGMQLVECAIVDIGEHDDVLRRPSVEAKRKRTQDGAER